MTFCDSSVSTSEFDEDEPVPSLQRFTDQIDRIAKNVLEKNIQTPLSLLVIAFYLNRLNFIGTINARLRWDPQWKFSPGVPAQLLVLVPGRAQHIVYY